MATPLTLPEIPEAENTPLVRQLLEIIRTQQDRIQQLEDEILRLKGLKTRPVIAPSLCLGWPSSPRCRRALGFGYFSGVFLDPVLGFSG